MSAKKPRNRPQHLPAGVAGPSWFGPAFETAQHKDAMAACSWFEQFIHLWVFRCPCCRAARAAERKRFRDLLEGKGWPRK